MKILLLNPHIDAEHKILKVLQADHAVLLPENAAEAWQMTKLHGQSLNLAIIHREADARSDTDGDVGIKLIGQLKRDPTQADLPIILTSSSWGDTDFVRHQESPQGVNAYLRWPFSEAQLKATLRAMFGEAGSSAPETEAASASASLPSLESVGGSSQSVALEEATRHYSGGAPSNSTSISLEAPWTDDGAEPPAILPSTPPQMSASAVEIGQGLDLATGGSSVLELSSDMGLASAPFSGEPVNSALPVPMEELAEPAESPIQSTLQSTRISAPQAAPSAIPSIMLQPLPFGDAVVPGGAAHSPDTETLKKYLLLREQDVATLSAQLRAAKEQATMMSSQLEEERAKNSELLSAAESHRRELDDARKAGEQERENLRKEIEDLRFELRAKLDKARILEAQVREATQEMERLKERVRSDIRKIRVREKELENRLEIARSDSEVLVHAREAKIVELKRKLDLLEFNMDLLQDRYTRERENSMKLRERLVKAAQVVRVAGGVLDSPAAPENSNTGASSSASTTDILTESDEGKREAS